MLSSLLVLLSTVAAPTLESGALLTCRGEVVAVKGNPAESRKTFELTALVTDVTNSGGTMYWTIAEAGHEGWPWIEHFGRVRLDDRLAGAGELMPSLLYRHATGYTVVPLRAPLFVPPKPLAADVEWTENRTEYRVVEADKIGKRDAWQIEGRTVIASRRLLTVDQQSPLLLALRDIVFMGPGVEHEVTWQLTDFRQLDAQQIAAAETAFNGAIDLRHRLARKPRLREADWNAEQQKLLKAELPELAKLAAGTPLGGVIEQGLRDELFQRGRTDAVNDLVAAYVGKQMPKFKLAGGTSLNDAPLTSEDLKGKVTVLHFWEYREQPLIEPYGQVGYLDFLYRDHKEAGLHVYGVNVDDRLARDPRQKEAVQSARNFKAFMNLRYPVLLDGGETLTLFGDPRRLKQDLPLFVLIGADGKIIHYQPGYYKVSSDRGLNKLDVLVRNALEDSAK